MSESIVVVGSSAPPIDTSEQTIKVYVRKGAHNEQRIISFARPAKVSVKELLEMGIAIDGTQATFAVTGECLSSRNGDADWIYYSPFSTRAYVLEARANQDRSDLAGSLPDAVNEAELELIKFLQVHGYSTEFI